MVAQAKLFANACFARNGKYLEHVGTIDQARDMDVLRAALGDAKLTYYGASYGTYLGAKYAQLFPTHIRAMVLDGALNPDEPATQENLVQAEGFETDLHDFLAACVAVRLLPARIDRRRCAGRAARAGGEPHREPVDGRRPRARCRRVLRRPGLGAVLAEDWSQLWRHSATPRTATARRCWTSPTR